MATTQDAEFLAQFGQRADQMGASLGDDANKITRGFPHNCDTAKAKQIYQQAEELSGLLRQCAERVSQIGNASIQEASRILGGG
jgi:hypothetical protein